MWDRPKILFQQDHGGLSIGADLGGVGPQGVGGLQGVPPLDAPAATAATPDVDVEPSDQGASRDLRLILGGDPGLPDGATAPGASLRQGRLEEDIDRRGAGEQAMTIFPSQQCALNVIYRSPLDLSAPAPYNPPG
jgi:hypothetical protein